ncbi:MAG: glycosyltransferase family 4 protein [Bacteroidota bacterium]
MRVLFVSHSFPPEAETLEANLGGMQRVATELYASLIETRAVHVHPLVLRTTWSRTHLRTPGFLLRAYRGIRRLVRDQAVDVVLFSSMVTATLAVPLRGFLHKHGVPTAAIVHGRDVTLDTWLHQRVVVPKTFRAVDAVMPVSQATGAQCLERGLPPDKLHVVPNGIDLHRFDPERVQGLSALPTRAPGAFVLCSVGRQVKRKGFAWFVEHVLPRLPDAVEYWLAGDGPEHDAIRDAAAQHGVAERVRLLGRISEADLARLYWEADLFVMPNIPVPGDMEGFGVVMLEAGLCGVPVVAARLEGIQDVITEGQNGHLVESGDAPGFTAAIRPYHEDAAALQALSERAAQHVIATFSWQAVAQRYVSALLTLVRQTHVPQRA